MATEVSGQQEDLDDSYEDPGSLVIDEETHHDTLAAHRAKESRGQPSRDQGGPARSWTTSESTRDLGTRD